MYQTAVRPALTYDMDTAALTNRQVEQLETAEMKMLRFTLGVTKLEKIRNEYIRGTAGVGGLGDKLREGRLGWFGHVQRREPGYLGRRVLNHEIGRRERWRPKRRYMDTIREDMREVGVEEEVALDGVRWTGCGGEL